jgi:hypothetical protein
VPIAAASPIGDVFLDRILESVLFGRNLAQVPPRVDTVLNEAAGGSLDLSLKSIRESSRVAPTEDLVQRAISATWNGRIVVENQNVDYERIVSDDAVPSGTRNHGQ